MPSQTTKPMPRAMRWCPACSGRRMHVGTPNRARRDGTQWLCLTCYRDPDRRRQRAEWAKTSEAWKDRRKAVMGRVCRWCSRTDKQARFDSHESCNACLRRGYRNTWCKRCGFPLYNTAKRCRNSDCPEP